MEIKTFKAFFAKDWELATDIANAVQLREVCG